VLVYDHGGTKREASDSTNPDIDVEGYGARGSRQIPHRLHRLVQVSR